MNRGCTQRCRPEVQRPATFEGLGVALCRPLCAHILTIMILETELFLLQALLAGAMCTNERAHAQYHGPGGLPVPCPPTPRNGVFAVASSQGVVAAASASRGHATAGASRAVCMAGVPPGRRVAALGAS